MSEAAIDLESAKRSMLSVHDALSQAHAALADARTVAPQDSDTADVFIRTAEGIAQARSLAHIVDALLTMEDPQTISVSTDAYDAMGPDSDPFRDPPRDDDAAEIVCPYCVQWRCSDCKSSHFPNCCDPAMAQVIRAEPYWPDGSVATLTQNEACDSCNEAINEYIKAHDDEHPGA